MGTEAVFPCDTTATPADLNTDDKVLLWRPQRGTCSSRSMDSLCKHRDECIYSAGLWRTSEAAGLNSVSPTPGLFRTKTKGAMWQNIACEVHSDAAESHSQVTRSVSHDECGSFVCKGNRIRNTTGRAAELRPAAVCRVVCVKRSDCNVTSENKLVPLIFKS